jgi:hypothetical protein
MLRPDWRNASSLVFGKETRMTSNTRITLACGIALALAVALGSTSRAQTPDSAKPERKMAGMMADRQKMMAEMQASQKRLDDLLAAANAAHGTDKVDRLTAVVTELVAQQRHMGRHMMSMSGMGATQGALESPAPDAVRKAPAGVAPAGPTATEEDHAAHHPKP